MACLCIPQHPIAHKPAPCWLHCLQVARLAKISRLVLKEEEIFPWESPGLPWRRPSLKGATAFSTCSCEPWCNHEPALLSTLILVQVCSHQVQTWGLKMPLAEDPGAASTSGLTEVTAAVWGSHRLYKRMQKCTRRMMPRKRESVRRQFTEQSPKFTPDIASSHTWSCQTTKQLWLSLPPRTKPRAGKQMQSSRDVSHTPSPPEQCR